MSTDEEGTAVIEFVLLAVVLLVPFVYAVLCLFEVERAAFALTAASREAGRAFVTGADSADAEDRAAAAVALALRDRGVAGSGSLQITCTDDPCLTPGAQVVVEVSTRVDLPLVPAWGDRSPASVVVRARHVEVVDRYREERP